MEARGNEEYLRTLGECSAASTTDSGDPLYWAVPSSERYFDRVDYDVDSIAIVGNADLSWLSPPWEFECRLDVVGATLLEDKKVNVVALYLRKIYNYQKRLQSSMFLSSLS